MFSAFSVHRRGLVCLATAALVPGLAAVGAIVAAAPAVADDVPQHKGGATATLSGLKVYGQAVVHGSGDEQEEQPVPAGLFEMSVDNGGTLQTYCTDIRNPTQKDAKYQETPWSGTSLGENPDAGRIRWILQNSYPQVNNLAELARKAGARSLSEQDAAAGTQVAIWRYSDDADVDALDPDAEKLADYLQKSAQNLAEPRASLTLDPPAVAGHPGDRLGPVTVRTEASRVSVAPPADSAMSGVKVVDKNGTSVTSASDGTPLYFEVPKGAPDGSAELQLQASTTVAVGRAFASETRSQTQILAGSSESTVSARATADWAKAGAIPAVSAEKDCVQSGVGITVSNQGDEAFTFELMGLEHSIGAGKSQTVTIPLQDDQAYDFTINGPNGLEKRIKGVLDCRTESAAGGDTVQAASALSPASVGGTSGGSDLAATGSSSATPLIAAIAVVLVVAGGAAVFVVRRKTSAEERNGERTEE